MNRPVAAVDRVYVVNLEDRTDRLSEMRAELRRINLDAEDSRVKIFKAIRPDAPGPFPSIGARGCFLSQLGVLQHACDNGYRAILLLEDDAAFTEDFIANQQAILRELDGTNWSVAYLGHRIDPDDFPEADEGAMRYWRPLSSQARVECAHAVLFSRDAITLLVAYLECMMSRPPGDPAGGPMHVDGAYSWFRRDHPGMLTFVTPRQYVVQRASRSDIAPSTWKDKIPFIRWLRALKNRRSRQG